MPFLEIHNVCKTYGDYQALKNVTFNLPNSHILGLLGPNGAGKTTLIRMITNILIPDSGTIYLDNNLCINFNMKQVIGYMPEERGLYKKMKVGEQLIYLAQLRGLRYDTAKKKIMYWLQRLESENFYNKTIDELSKGMSQKVQFIATVMCDPKLLILDEPFSGLDPINSDMLKNEIYNLKKNGTTIIFSTHRMEQVEEICDSIVLMNKGAVILQGDVKDIKKQFKENHFAMSLHTPFLLENNEHFIVLDNNDNMSYQIQLQGMTSTNHALQYCIALGASVASFHEILPSINQIFIQQVEKTKAITA